MILCKEILSSLKSQAIGDDFEHLIAHTLSCTLESEDVSVIEYGRLKFGSLDEVIKVDDLVCINEGKGVLEDGSWMCIEQEKAQGKQCTNTAASHSKNKRL